MYLPGNIDSLEYLNTSLVVFDLELMLSLCNALVKSSKLYMYINISYDQFEVVSSKISRK